MKLPNPDQAEISEQKIYGYLLSPDHSVGRHKARFFGRFGFGPSNWHELLEALRGFASMRASRKVETEYGSKYEIRGQLVGPNGRGARIVTVWMVRTGESRARFVTAYPEE